MRSRITAASSDGNGAYHGDAVVSSRVGFDGTVYIASDDFNVYALRTTDNYPDVKWSYAPAGRPSSRDWNRRDRLCRQLDKIMYALRTRVAHPTVLELLTDGGPTLSGGPICPARPSAGRDSLFGCEDGDVYALTATTGRSNGGSPRGPRSFQARRSGRTAQSISQYGLLCLA